jgi:hypothetical protein
MKRVSPSFESHLWRFQPHLLTVQRLYLVLRQTSTTKSVWMKGSKIILHKRIITSCLGKLLLNMNKTVSGEGSKYITRLHRIGAEVSPAFQAWGTCRR